MDTITLILLYISTFLAIAYTFINIVKWQRGHEISQYNCVIMAISITTIIFIERFWLW